MTILSALTPVTLTITGMSCGHCVRAVEAALAAVPGVTSRRVTVGAAELALAPGASADAAVAAIGDAGYEAHVATPAPARSLPQSNSQNGCGCGCGAYPGWWAAWTAWCACPCGGGPATGGGGGGGAEVWWWWGWWTRWLLDYHARALCGGSEPVAIAQIAPRGRCVVALR